MAIVGADEFDDARLVRLARFVLLLEAGGNGAAHDLVMGFLEADELVAPGPDEPA